MADDHHTSTAAEADPAGADATPPANPIRAAVEAAAPYVPDGDAGAGDEAPGGEGEGSGGKRRRRPRQRDQLFEEFGDLALWHDPSGEPFITLEINGHKENWPIKSPPVERFVAWRHYQKTNSVLSASALADFLRVAQAKAVSEGRMHATFMRFGQHGGDLYYDRGAPDWGAIRITPDGWHEVPEAPCKFVRSKSMLEAPVPVGGAASATATLRRFLPADDAAATLCIAWNVAAMRPTGPYPILLVGGEQGAGKSVFLRLMRTILDPSIAPIRSMPKEERDLVVAAFNSPVLAFDNVSGFASWQSDALCRMATGGAFGTRELYNDRSENLVEFIRPLIINGIGDIHGRPDLADRGLSINLPAIDEKERRTEREMLAEFNAAWPEILGGLLDIASMALRRLPGIKLKGAPRLADFCEWILAAAPAMDVEPEEFLAIYSDNRRGVAEMAFSNDPFAVALFDYVQNYHPSGLSMEPNELFTALNAAVGEEVRRFAGWPKNVAGFGTRIRRIGPLLRAKGLALDTGHSGKRRITIVPRREG